MKHYTSLHKEVTDQPHFCISVQMHFYILYPMQKHMVRLIPVICIYLCFLRKLSCRKISYFFTASHLSNIVKWSWYLLHHRSKNIQSCMRYCRFNETTASLQHRTTALLHHCTTSQLHQSTTALQHHCTTAPKHHYATAPLHHCTIALQQHISYIPTPKTHNMMRPTKHVCAHAVKLN